MTLTISQARDAICSFVSTAWLADATAATIEMQWDNFKADDPGEDGATTQPESFARTTVRTLDSPQVTIGRPRKYRTTCLLTVQIFTPQGDGNALGDQLMQVVVDALRSHVSASDGVTFFDIKPIEVGPDSIWFHYQVTASASYQETVS